MFSRRVRLSAAYFSILLSITLTGCWHKVPPSFQRTEPVWNSVEIRDGMLFDQAWQEAVDVLAKKFELEMIAKDGGYVRSAWKYDWARAGEFRTDYRVRTFLKFSPNNKKVDLMTEAQYLNDNGWAAGTDTRLFHVVKTDIMGAVGRTTR